MPAPTERTAPLVDALCALTLQSRAELAKSAASRELLRDLLRAAAPALGARTADLEREALRLCRRGGSRRPGPLGLAARLPRGAGALETCRRILRRLEKEMSR
ncbi:MAG: hypothetical protein WC969_07745 [Elusimicrobiota bacterium]|jgi:hypothetical protein